MKLAQADINFSKYIRKRDSINGVCTCPLCNFSGEWKGFACGHFIKRRHLLTRWHEDNAMSICFQCNGDMEGNENLSNRYAEIIMNRIGAERWNDLMRLRQSNEKLLQYEIDEIAEYYKNKLNGKN